MHVVCVLRFYCRVSFGGSRAVPCTWRTSRTLSWAARQKSKQASSISRVRLSCNLPTHARTRTHTRTANSRVDAHSFTIALHDFVCVVFSDNTAQMNGGAVHIVNGVSSFFSARFHANSVRDVSFLPSPTSARTPMLGGGAVYLQTTSAYFYGSSELFTLSSARLISFLRVFLD